MSIKKILAFILFLTVISNASFSQTDRRWKVACITQSCCSIGPWTMEVWSEKTCVYIAIAAKSATDRGTYILELTPTSTNSINSFTITEDILMTGIFDSAGNTIILPQGDYNIVNNQIEFVPSAKTAMPKLCYIREVSGQFLGHPYHYTITICVEFILLKGLGTNGSIAMTPRLTQEDRDLLIKSNNEIVFNEDIIINEGGLNLIIPQGKYTVNDDGNIYFQNYKLN